MIKTSNKSLQLISPDTGDKAVFNDEQDTTEFVEKTTSITVNSSLREVEFEDDQEVVYWLFVNLVVVLLNLIFNFYLFFHSFLEQ